MIFVTVGSQMPFDRLIKAVDEWCATQADDLQVLAQVGDSRYTPVNLKTIGSLNPNEFNQRCRSAVIIVAHAGMGSILTALELGKPLVLLPRLGSLRETRNDHQVATAQWLGKRDGVFVAKDESEVGGHINRALAESRQPRKIELSASNQFIDKLKEFIDA